MARWFGRKRRDTADQRPASALNRRQRVILTAEGLPLTLTLASRGVRAAALLIDLFLIVMGIIGTTVVLGYIAKGVGLDQLSHGSAAAGDLAQAVIVVWIIAAFLARSAWFLWFELGPRGATPGKRLTGIRIAARPGSDGGATRLSAEAVIARNLLRDIELFMPIVFVGGALNAGADTTLAGWASLVWFGIFALFPFFNRDGLRCGDVIAGTWVVETPRSRLDTVLSLGTAAQGISTITGAQYRFSEADLAVYGEYELQMLERVLRDNRPQALTEVAETICRKIGWTSGAGDERAFLDAYYTQLRARLETGMRLGRRKADKFDPGPAR
ncbi:RDD family protein [Novosphingobium sp.]|uniref:RDD family protein n=1 Tax=Novosphingobium sp. TaxID=1874826 RepID=UPI00334184BF